MARPPQRDATAQVHGVVSEFFGGFATLFQGFAWWKRRPGLMLLGLIPAAIVFVGLIALVLVIATYVQGFVGWLTPFADTWDPGLAAVFRAFISLALLIGFVLIGAFGFTALTLLIGDVFYERIWRAVENQLGDFVTGHEPGFWRSVFDSFRLIPPAALTAALLSLLGLIPVVGTVLAAVLGVFFSGRILARELTARPMEARGLTRQQRRELLRLRPRRVLGFGVAVQLCFLVPGGAIIVMPAAVAGATHLTRDLLAVAGDSPAPVVAKPE